MNNPQAFPSGTNRIDEYTDHALEDGMTLRDYFAAKAMQALIEGSLTETGNNNITVYQKKVQTVEELIAEISYIYADAMLKIREQVK